MRFYTVTRFLKAWSVNLGFLHVAKARVVGVQQAKSWKSIQQANSCHMAPLFRQQGDPGHEILRAMLYNSFALMQSLVNEHKNRDRESSPVSCTGTDAEVAPASRLRDTGYDFQRKMASTGFSRKTNAALRATKIHYRIKGYTNNLDSLQIRPRCPHKGTAQQRPRADSSLS